jgi:hypothetical protein
MSTKSVRTLLEALHSALFEVRKLDSSTRVIVKQSMLDAFKSGRLMENGTIIEPASSTTLTINGIAFPEKKK